MRSKHQQSGTLARTVSGGFTLVELAVVTVIVALLLGAILTPLATQFQARKNHETERALREIKEALMGFAVSNGRLPCPDTDGDGIENPPLRLLPPAPPATCTALVGALPWITLGTVPTDAWGRIYQYHVSEEFASFVQTGRPPSDPLQLDLDDGGVSPPADLITVITRGDDPVTGGTIENKAELNMTTNAPAVVVSVGSNGLGGTRLTGGVLAAPTGGDEAENLDGDTRYVLRIQTLDKSGCADNTDETTSLCEYDDLIIWISPSELLNRLVQVGRLP